MKIKIIATLVLMVLHIKSFSQEYSPLLNNSAWTILVADFGGSHNMEIDQSNDVSVGGYTYKKFIGESNQEFLLREDVASKRVYKLIDGTDILLYDFSLQVSDNITLIDGQTYQVESISNIIVNGGLRRQFFLRNLSTPFLSDEIWVEGVGRKTHPLLAINEFYTDPDFYLMCSFQNGINIYNEGLATGGSATNCYLGVEEQRHFFKKISFGPNPFENELLILSPTDLSNATLKAYNSTGQIVRETGNLNGRRILFKRERLNSGLYLIQLSENGKILTTTKVIIAE